MPSLKYHRLARYLAAHPRDRVVLTEPAIAAILGTALPVEARDGRLWSNNPRTSHTARAWRAVGWHVAERVYRHPRWVITFAWDGADSTAQLPARQ